MDVFLDRAWDQIQMVLDNLVFFLDHLVSPLEVMGPGWVIFILAFLVVGFTRILARFFVTRRFLQLKKEFEHWQGVRQEALKHPDREKGKILARNIDQGQLNRAYYDFFFEGLLKSLFSNILPILLMAAHVTRVYTPQTLLDRFGNQWVFSVDLGTRINFSSLFWFVISLILSFILFYLIKSMGRAVKKRFYP